MTTGTITLEMTQAEANMLLESVITECIRFRKYIDHKEAQGESASPRALANMDALDYLVSALKAKTGRW